MVCQIKLEGECAIIKSLSSYQELDALGESIAKDYTIKASRTDSQCFDIEGFIRDYLKLNIVYETIVEENKSKIGYLSDGFSSILVLRNKKKVPVVFPVDTIIIEKYLLQNSESSRRRFTLSHEAAHKILKKHNPIKHAGCFYTEYTPENNYSSTDMNGMFSLDESYANRLGAAIIMPRFLVEKAVKRVKGDNPIIYYEGGVFFQLEKFAIQRIADDLGVSFSALVNRLRELNLLKEHPIEEYIEELNLGEIK